MNQTKLGSFIEIAISTAIGYVLAIISQVIIFPLYDVHVSLETDLVIGVWFTIISLARGYVLRRWFNAMLQRAALRLARKIEE